MLTTQWNPWRDLSQLEQAMNALYRNASTRPEGQTASAAWQPAVDIFEDNEKILVLADLPGVEQKDLELNVDKNVLSLRGERKSALVEGDGHQRAERVQGPFARSFTLPATVDAEHIGAELKNGVLTLTLPKKREAQPRQIKVQLG
jgi:HSP20 family protein